ncbi:uncharacterized protein N7496_002976 [Penicillium cataractarum]|uniref:Jacalin-type lectin domain-containing protein n=1 Tax=Penicillium cataractarum TaxID=2100454 RepID=A0A9W9SQB3_9EURO|nr:uncharacterized protein N7496_002976 [Penicillium cataractarum]KAJ5380548.1 hypothetical protein N7496_002976 [Penicillium cataractarum]
MAKRTLDSDSTAERRVKPTLIEKRPLNITNLNDGDVVHQTCLVIHGECQDFDHSEETNYVSVSTSEMLTRSHSTQHWPLNKGQWSALVMLSPGLNKLAFKLHHVGGVSDSLEIAVNYLPLLQLPPLHLAILVAKDSPLLIDCPPTKFGSISTAHSSIDSAVSKLRMSAYMWQALTAEDFRQKGLGRRSFRLEEEWAPNTTIHKNHQYVPGDNIQMGCMAKVHIIRSQRTVAELRDANVAQQNSRGRDRDALHRYFEQDLISSGAPFEPKNRPVVAGLILDSHYSSQQSLITAHAALGCHKPDGVSLGIFGSHLTYSWPRFLEEIPSCLTDLTPPGDTVGNDNGECDTMRGACFVGQGAFLHEVGHAFGAGHTTGIMARGYSKSWAMNFIQHKNHDSLKNDAKWDLQDTLQFKLLPHFALPGDELVTEKFQRASVKVEVSLEGDDPMESEGKTEGLKISCSAGLAQVKIQSGKDNPVVHDLMDDAKPACTLFQVVEMREKYDQTQPLKITALGLNGKIRVVNDFWAMCKDLPFILIPDSDVVLQKQSVRSYNLESAEDDDNFLKWAMLLRQRGKDGQLHRATSIDLRVGCTMDGAVVHYADGQHANCGPARRANGQLHRFGGHASKSNELPADEHITRVKICKQDDGWGSLSGIQMTLSNGTTWGHLNFSGNEDDDSDDGSDSDENSDYEDDQKKESVVVTLEPGEDEVIVGFFGKSVKGSGYTYEFGILTAPKGVELPEKVYDIAELRND